MKIHDIFDLVKVRIKMLNKEVLLVHCDEIPEGWYTHVLTVGRSSSPAYSYGYHEQEGYGSLSPNTIESSENAKVLTLEYNSGNYVVELVVDETLPNAWDLIMGRADTRVSLGTPNYAREDFGIASWDAPKSFISEKDLGKRIPIWLSTSHPPWA